MRLPFRTPEQRHVDVDLLSAYLDEQVAPAERVRVDGHLAACAACRNELESLRRTTALLQALPRVPVPRAFTLSEALVGVRRPQAQPGWMGWARGLAAVTAVALVAVLAVSVLNRPGWQPAATVARSAPTSAPEPAAQPATLVESTPAAELALAPAPPEAAVMAEAGTEKAGAAAADVAPMVAAAATPAAPVEAPAAPEPEPIAPMAAAAKVAATEAPSLMAMASAPQGTPAAGVMAFGLGAGAAEMAAQAQPFEPTPELGQPESELPATAGFVYADETGLWAVDGRSGVRQLVADESLSQPILSSDGSRVVYRVARGDYSELWTIRWDGTDAGLLLSEAELPASDLPAGYTERRLNDVQWLPGREVLAVTTVAIPGSEDLLPRLELWHLDVTSGALQRVADLARADRPFYAPDGTQFALLQYGTESDPTGELTLVNADGSDSRVALRFPAGPTTASFDSQIAWMPDGSGLWLYVPDPTTADGSLNGATLYRVPAAGGDVQSAGRVDGVQVFWSPDGLRLAYARAGKDGALDLFLANADGANPQLYASLGNGGFVNWASDGAHFIYTDGAGQTYAGSPDGAPQLLGKTSSLFDPRWISPRQLLALHDTGTNWLLVTRTLDGDAVGLQPLSHGATYDTTKP